nr:inactive peptidyl-prolyl cis-trans isomerase FKBP6-like [Dermacentor andersoni]
MELSIEPSEPPARTPVHISTTEMEDLTEDCGVMKKITQPGSGPVVTRHALVTFHYNAYVKCSWTERIDSTWMRNTPHRCNLKELGVLGLQIAVRSMRRSEGCYVKIAAGYGFGAQGCLPRIPPNATLVYEIALVDFTETEDDGGAVIDSRLMPTNTLFGDFGRTAFGRGVSALVHRTGRGTGHQEPDSTGLGRAHYGRAGHRTVFRKYLQPRRLRLHQNGVLGPKVSVLRRPGRRAALSCELAPPFAQPDLCTTGTGSTSSTWQPW